MDQLNRPLRIDLRSPTARDREPFLAAMRASREFHHPWLTAPTTAEAFDRLLSKVRDERFDPSLACRRRDGAIVGFFNLGEIVRGPLRAPFSVTAEWSSSPVGGT